MLILGSAASGGKKPGTPTIGTVTTGASQTLTVPFTAPTYTGKGGTVTYTATSTPGSITGTSTTSPISVTGLTNGTSYTFVVKATTSYGVSSDNSAASNSVAPIIPKAVVTGGTLTSDATYYYRTFTANDNLSISGAALVADYVLVAGGGSGGSSYYSRSGSARTGFNNNYYVGSGGGAGGVIYNTSQTLAINVYAVVIGGANSNSTAVGQTAVLGGAGVQGNSNGGAGGSGGGGSGYLNVDGPAGAGIGGTATSGQGNAGGIGYAAGSPTNGVIGGGGGGSTQTGRAWIPNSSTAGGAGGTYLD